MSFITQSFILMKDIADMPIYDQFGELHYEKLLTEKDLEKMSTYEKRLHFFIDKFGSEWSPEKTVILDTDVLKVTYNYGDPIRVGAALAEKFPDHEIKVIYSDEHESFKYSLFNKGAKFKSELGDLDLFAYSFIQQIEDMANDIEPEMDFGSNLAYQTVVGDFMHKFQCALTDDNFWKDEGCLVFMETMMMAALNLGILNGLNLSDDLIARLNANSEKRNK